MPNALVTAFNAGELSPFMDSRTDVEKYRSGCRSLENMVVLPYGGVYRRAGTEFMGKPKFDDRRCRLIGFNFSTTTRFVLELGHEYMRFWSNGFSVEAAFPTANWTANAVYKRGDYVASGGISYYVEIDHVADILSLDIAAGKIVPRTTLEIPLPYQEQHLREVQYIQLNDVMYFAHAEYPVLKVSRFADNDWGVQEVEWTYPPLVSLSDFNSQFTASAPMGNITLSTKDDFFTPQDIGTEIELVFGKNRSFVEGNINANGYSEVLPLKAGAKWDFTTNGIWNATVTIYKKTTEQMDRVLDFKAVDFTRAATVATGYLEAHNFQIGNVLVIRGAAAPLSGSYTVTAIPTDDTFEFTVANSGAAAGIGSVDNITQMDSIRVYDSNGDRNITSNGTEDYRTELIVGVSGYVSNTNGKYILEARDSTEGGRVKITGVTSPTSASGEVTEYLGLWTGPRTSRTAKQSAFCSKYGFPRCVTAHQQRLVFAGTKKNPQTIWASVTDDFEDFELGTTDDASFSFAIAANESNRINWLYSQKGILLGTSGDEWSVNGASSDEPITSTNVQVRRQTGFGSKYLRAIMVNDVLLFAQRSGRKVRELTYSFEKDGWVAPDLTVLAEQISETGFEEMAFQQQPDAVLWCVRNDGILSGMSYEREQNVVAWHRHITDGQFESVATIYGLNATDDEVWLLVKRQINGQTVRYIERFRPDFREAFATQNKDNYWYLDCALRYNGPAVTTLSGLDHLEGRTVSVLANGSAQPDKVVTGGQITLDKPATTVLVGLPYQSRVKPMKAEFQLQDGPTNSRKKKVYRASVSIYKSIAGEISTNGTTWEWMYPRNFTTRMDDSPEPYSGDKEVVLLSEYATDSDVEVRQRLPYPLTVRSLVIKLDVFGD
jgi:hypothetical protein